MNYPRIPEEEYIEAVREFKQQVGMTLNVFNCYGMGEFIPDVAGKIVTLAERFSMRTRGKNIAIKPREKPAKRGVG
mgnify:FL=1